MKTGSDKVAVLDIFKRFAIGFKRLIAIVSGHFRVINNTRPFATRKLFSFNISAADTSNTNHIPATIQPIINYNSNDPAIVGSFFLPYTTITQ